MKVGNPRAENGVQFLLEANGKFGMESWACKKVSFQIDKGGEERTDLKKFPFSC